MWKPALERPAVLAEPLDHVGVLLRHHDRGLGDDDDDEHGQDDDDDERTRHASSALGADQERQTVDALDAAAPPAAARRPSWSRTDHDVPRSSALPTAPGARSSSSVAISPETCRPRRLARGAPAQQAARNSTSEPTETPRTAATGATRGRWRRGPTSAPTTSAPRPKKRTKNPPGVRTSTASSARPPSTHTTSTSRSESSTRPAGGKNPRARDACTEAYTRKPACATVHRCKSSGSGSCAMPGTADVLTSPGPESSISGLPRSLS